MKKNFTALLFLLALSFSAFAQSAYSPAATAGEYVPPQYATASVTPTSVQNTSAPASSVQFMSINIPSAGVWEIEYSVRGAGTQGSSGAGGISAGLYDDTPNFLANSEVIANFWSATTANSQSSGTRKYIVTTTGAAIYNVRVWNSASTALASAIADNNGRSYISATKISGFLPVVGPIVDYIAVKRSSNQTGIAVNGFILFNQTDGGNIPYNATTGEFTLTAGKTYKLEAYAKIRNDGTGGTGRYVQIEWSNSAGVVLSGLKQGVAVMATSALNESDSNFAGGIYTPSTNQIVKVKVTGVDGANLELDGGRTSAFITQLGSSVLAGISFNASNNNNLAQTVTIGTATTVNASTRRIVVNPASVLASHTFTLPSAPNDGDQTLFFFGGTIANGSAAVTTLSIVPNAGQTIKQTSTPSTAVGGDTIIYEYNSALLAWVRIR